MDVWIARLMYRWMDRFMDVCFDEWVDGRIGKRIDG
jgi:hypothetical protein